MEVFPRLNQARGVFNIDGVPSSTSNLTQDPWSIAYRHFLVPPRMASGRAGTLKSFNSKDFTGFKKIGQGKCGLSANVIKLNISLLYLVGPSW